MAGMRDECEHLTGQPRGDGLAARVWSPKPTLLIFLHSHLDDPCQDRGVLDIGAKKPSSLVTSAVRPAKSDLPEKGHLGVSSTLNCAVCAPAHAD